MATLRIYLDTRRKKQDGSCPLKIQVNHESKTSLVGLGINISPTQWDAVTQKIVKHPNMANLNKRLQRILLSADDAIFELKMKRRKRTSLKELRAAVEASIYPDAEKDDRVLFLSRFSDFAEKKKGNTRNIYITTRNRIIAYDSQAELRSFDEIDRKWLQGFDAFLAMTSPSANARAVHMRNIRAVFNDALDDEVITCYPFRKFKIKTEATQKRSLSVDELREFINYPCEEHQKQYVDMFLLIFLLIGINTADLCELKEIRGGRIEYRRRKTKRLYSIKVEPEALKIIEEYKGKQHLLNISDRYTDYRDYRHRLNENLKKIGKVEIKGRGGKKVRTPIQPELTTYWARHTWATIAASLEIPKETIAAALGHGGNTVTDIYIDFDRKKVDEANRKVIDYVMCVSKQDVKKKKPGQE